MIAHDSKKILAKLVYLLKRSLDEWIETDLCCTKHLDFNKSQLPLFMSIGTSGISNSELAVNLNISKQAASKIIKELETNDLVKSQKNPDDARSELLFLTDNGMFLYNHIISQIDLLEAEYKKIVGAKNYQIAIDVMCRLTSYHEQLKKVALN